MASGTVWLRLGWVMALLGGSGALAQEAPPPQPPQASSSSQAEPPPAPREEGSSVQWQLMAGGMSVLDGYDSLGHQGLLLASGWEFPSWRLRFHFMAGLPTLFQQDPRFEVRLWQYTVGMGVDVPVYTSGPLRWAVGAGAGLLVFARSSFSFSGGVDADNPRFVPSLLAGPETSVRWQLSRILAAEATFALDVVAGRPILGFAENNSFQTIARGSAVRPRLSLVLMIAP